MTFAPLPTAICAATTVDVALAACFFELGAPGAEQNLIDIQLTPAGHFSPRDGRAMDVPAWIMDREAAEAVIAKAAALKTPLVVDYEHQTLKAAENGQPAPAAGFIRTLEWREGQGLFAKVELTARARQFVLDGEYRYVSPVFRYAPRTGRVTELVMAAITNNPALDGMADLTLQAAARFSVHQGTHLMNKYLLAILTALGINADAIADDEAACAAIEACIKEERANVAALHSLLHVTETETAGDRIAALTRAASAEPDPAKYVPIAIVADLQNRLAAATGQQQEQTVAAAVEDALANGRLLPSQKDWAIQLGTKDMAALTAYLNSTPAIAALSGSQTGGQPPAATATTTLASDELAVCAAFGMTPEEFAKAKLA